MKKTLFVFLLGSFMAVQAFAQAPSAKYMEQSIDGYIHLYFDQQYYLVDQNCVYKKFTRVIKYDKEKGGFNSFFTDYYNNNQPALSGKYIEEKKEGEFKGFYETGKPKFTISFKNNLPNGDWKFFYPSGNLWLNLAYINKQLFIKDFYDEKGRQKIKDGKGKLVLTEPALDFNEFGYTGVTFEGRVKEGKPEGIWSTYLSYPKGSPEYIGIEKFNDGKFEGSNYSFPQNFSHKNSLIRFYPAFLAENAEGLVFKGCTIDDNQGYNVYLQNFLNSSIIFEKSDVLPTAPFIVKIKIDENGKLTDIATPDSLNTSLSNVLKQVLTNVPYWIPSYINGKTIPDDLNITLNIYQNDEEKSYFSYPIINRQEGR
ncbi:hypothetical protein I5M32_00325 [Pedobacter sp. SD-b]|uniref:MORN repeat variant n=1 Tax=Pedobacter segetis TaxID=2793069 RepID=A0ABS1BEV2_9SPHI|nr:hypothetical protein [Pedobacter segetis]MBK0381389.1 hypothetical protein [Pedobacter segetis]